MYAPALARKGGWNVTHDRATLLNEAAKKIEYDGTEGYQNAAALVGEDIATALLIAHIRHSFVGGGFPEPAGTWERVAYVLMGVGILT